MDLLSIANCMAQIENRVRFRFYAKYCVGYTNFPVWATSYERTNYCRSFQILSIQSLLQGYYDKFQAIFAPQGGGVT